MYLFTRIPNIRCSPFIYKQFYIPVSYTHLTLQSELASQKATYDGAKAEYEYQEKNFQLSKGLHEKSLISDTDYEQALYNYQKAKSNYDSSKASLAKAERNLSYATITSPIDGVVILSLIHILHIF